MYSHLESIIRIPDAIFAGSHYLLDYSSKFNSNVYSIPTPVDTHLFSPKDNFARLPLTQIKLSLGG